MQNDFLIGVTSVNVTAFRLQASFRLIQDAKLCRHHHNAIPLHPEEGFWRFLLL